MFKRLIAAIVAAAVTAAALTFPASAKEIKQPFLACKKVEDLLKVIQFKDNQDLLIAYILGVVANGKCVMLDAGQQVEVVENLPTIGFTIIKYGVDNLYTASLAFEPRED